MSIDHEGEFILHDLIRREKLVLHDEFKDISAVFDAILPRDAEGTIVRPLLIGIDGSVTAGKSFFASKLDAYLSKKGINCALIYGDWYMASRERRKQEITKALGESYSISSYDEMNCNFEEIANTQKHISDFLYARHGSKNVKVANAYNRDTGERDKTINLELQEQSVVIFEGTGVHSAKLSAAFDLSIRVDVDSYQETIERLVMRENEKDAYRRLPKEFLQQRYDLIDRKYDAYLRSRDSQYFDILLDTSDKSLVKIYKRQ